MSTAIVVDSAIDMSHEHGTREDVETYLSPTARSVLEESLEEDLEEVELLLDPFAIAAVLLWVLGLYDA